MITFPLTDKEKPQTTNVDLFDWLFWFLKVCFGILKK